MLVSDDEHKTLLSKGWVYSKKIKTTDKKDVRGYKLMKKTEEETISEPETDM